MSPWASGYQLNTRMNYTKMHGCQCQNMQMRMHGDHSRNLLFQFDVTKAASVSCTPMEVQRFAYEDSTDSTLHM
eukprot:5784095-Pleurochrysis_carterae.AAC.3